MTRKINVLKHRLVPRHVVLSREDAKRVLSRMGVKKTELPWMFSTDPVAEALGAQPGDVVMIIRESPTAGRSVSYRLVISG